MQKISTITVHVLQIRQWNCSSTEFSSQNFILPCFQSEAGRDINGNTRHCVIMNKSNSKPRYVSNGAMTAGRVMRKHIFFLYNNYIYLVIPSKPRSLDINGNRPR